MQREPSYSHEFLSDIQQMDRNFFYKTGNEMWDFFSFAFLGNLKLLYKKYRKFTLTDCELFYQYRPNM